MEQLENILTDENIDRFDKKSKKYALYFLIFAIGYFTAVIVRAVA